MTTNLAIIIKVFIKYYTTPEGRGGLGKLGETNGETSPSLLCSDLAAALDTGGPAVAGETLLGSLTGSVMTREK